MHKRTYTVLHLILLLTYIFLNISIILYLVDEIHQYIIFYVPLLLIISFLTYTFIKRLRLFLLLPKDGWMALHQLNIVDGFTILLYFIITSTLLNLQVLTILTYLILIVFLIVDAFLIIYINKTTKCQYIHNYFNNHTCPICLEENSDFLHEVECKHIFHIRCFQQWCYQQAIEQTTREISSRMVITNINFLNPTTRLVTLQSEGLLNISCPVCRSRIDHVDIFFNF